MTRTTAVGLALIAALATLPTIGAAQATPQPGAVPPGAPGPGGPGGARGGGQGAPARIDVATAKRALAAAEAAAAMAMVRVAIAVVDANGDLVAFTRLDGASARAVTSAQGKARASILFGLPTKQVADAMAANQPLSVTITNPPAGAWEITPMQGAVPVIKDGRVIAASGVGGAAPAVDEQIATAGANAIR
jgi:glc operon protein GlcG